MNETRKNTGLKIVVAILAIGLLACFIWINTLTSEINRLSDSLHSQQSNRQNGNYDLQTSILSRVVHIRSSSLRRYQGSHEPATGQGQRRLHSQRRHSQLPSLSWSEYQ